jgi:hypothetical protein
MDEVFAFLSNMENNTKWRASQIDVTKTSPGPIGVGTTYRMVNRVFGRRLETEAEVVEYEPPRKYTSRDKSGTLPLKAQRIFEPAATGTRVTLILDAQPRGLLRLVEPIFGSLGTRRLKNDLARARDLIESRAR